MHFASYSHTKEDKRTYFVNSVYNIGVKPGSRIGDNAATATCDLSQLCVYYMSQKVQHVELFATCRKSVGTRVLWPIKGSISRIATSRMLQSRHCRRYVNQALWCCTINPKCCFQHLRVIIVVCIEELFDEVESCKEHKLEYISFKCLCFNIYLAWT